MTSQAGGGSATTTCRVCQGSVTEFLDLGRQPLSNEFITPEQVEGEFFYRLAVGICAGCAMVQLMEEVPREKMFREEYPYYSSGSSVMREHFAKAAKGFLETELTGDDPFIVEIGSNDGIMLRTVKEAGVRHLGFEPSGEVARHSVEQAGISVLNDFFQESTATAVREEHGPADVIYAANTMCHIPYLDSIFKGVDALLGPDGILVFEDPYWGDIVERTSFDQIYDEHFYLYGATSIKNAAARFGFELVDVERLQVHGGELRYTIARPGARKPSERLAQVLAEEESRDLGSLATAQRFAADVNKVREDLVALLRGLKDEGKTVAAYGATAKSATVTNFCGIGPDLVAYVCDTTPEKQDRLSPGVHIPVRPPEAFSGDYPDYALLFAWNHADEIMAKEQEFRDSGGRWILYVPDARVV